MVGRNSLRKSTRRKMSRRGRSRMSKRAQKGGGEKPSSSWLVEKMTSGYKDASMEEYVRGLSQPRYLYNIIAKEAASKAVAGDETTTKTLMSGGSYIYEMYIYDKELLQYHYLWFSYTGLSDLNKRMKERAWPQRKDITKIYKAATTYQRAGVIVQTLDNYLTAPEMGGTTIDGLFGTNDGIAWKERDIYHLNLTSSDSAPQTEPQALHGEVSASLEPQASRGAESGPPISRDREYMKKCGAQWSAIVREIRQMEANLLTIHNRDEQRTHEEKMRNFVLEKMDEINNLLQIFADNNVLLKMNKPQGRFGDLPDLVEGTYFRINFDEFGKQDLFSKRYFYITYRLLDGSGSRTSDFVYWDNINYADMDDKEREVEEAMMRVRRLRDQLSVPYQLLPERKGHGLAAYPSV